MLSALLALLAACANAASNVIQRIANRDEEQVPTLSLRLVWALFHRPLWFAGLAAVTLSFVLQATALRFGSLALVEPLIVFELPLTFVVAAVVLHSRLGVREWAATAVMAVGLGLLIGFLDPRNGHHQLGFLGWIVGLGVTGALVVSLVIAGRRRRGTTRAALYGAATGVQFGLTAALMKATMATLSSGPAALFTSWTTYAMVACGILGMFLLQNALQAGRLVAAQPGITLLDPTVAMVWGIVGFHELTNTGLLLIPAVAGGIAMAIGALLLVRSPLLAEASAFRTDHLDAEGSAAGDSPTSTRDTTFGPGGAGERGAASPGNDRRS